MSKTLLPTGCYDLLPPQARQESYISSVLLLVFESFGYEQVSPPLLEYSESLLSGRGSSFSNQIFRVMDPTAHKVMGISADITLQIARIAASKLAKAPRPLRLCYNGLILRMQGEQLKGNRQLRQTGIELIGAAGADADAEVILVAAGALKRAGVDRLSIDLNLPGIVSTLLQNEKFAPEQLTDIFNAVEQKDVSSLKKYSFTYRDALIAIIQNAGASSAAFAAIEKLTLPEAAHHQIEELKQVVEIIKSAGENDWAVTIDATENRGAEYHSGISFSIFVPGAVCEVGRGGRYRIEHMSSTEEATGFTLYVETLRELLQPEPRGNRVLVNNNVSIKDTEILRKEGYITLFALSEYGASKEEAVRMGCEYIYQNGSIEKL